MCRPKLRPAAMCRFKLRPCENKAFTLALRNGREQMLLPFKQSTAMCRLKFRPAAMCRLKFRPCENKVLTLAFHNGREQMIIIFITLYSVLFTCLHFFVAYHQIHESAVRLLAVRLPLRLKIGIVHRCGDSSDRRFVFLPVFAV